MSKPPYRGTRLRSFRIEDELYDDAREISRETGVPLSDVVRDALVAFVESGRSQA